MRSNRVWTDQKLERAFRLDESAGPAKPLERGVEAAIVLAALSGAGFAVPPPVGGGGGGAAPATPGASGVPGVKGATATAKASAVGKLALVIGGGAAVTAAVIVAWIAVRPRHEETIATTQPATPVVRAQTPPAPEAPAPQPAAPVVSPPVVVHVERPAPAPAPHAHHDRDRHVEATHAPAEPAPEIAPEPPAAPEDLLAEANAARAAHQWSKADALYAKVAAMPNRLAADTALVADAQLHLEHLGDPAGAARRFRAALAASPRGALAEDARWGLAEAARALGDAGAEKAALDDFLAHHADSPLASRARARAAELSKP